MFDITSSTSLPLHVTPQAEPPSKEDFSRLVRRIMYSNSGQFAPIKIVDGETQSFAVNNRDWNHYRELALKAEKDGNLAQAEFMWLASLSEAKGFHPDDPRLLISIESLSNLYATLGRFDQAEAFGKQAVDVAVKAFGHDHPNLARCLNSLAGIYYQQGRFKDGEPVCRRLLAIYEKNYQSDHPDVVMGTINLAMIYHAQGKFKLAERLYIRAITLGHDSQSEFNALLCNYANLLDATDRGTLAKEVRARGKHIFRSA